MMGRLNTRISSFSLLPQSLITFTILLLIFPTLTHAQDVLWLKINGPWKEEADPTRIFSSLLSKNMATASSNPKVIYAGGSKGDGSTSWSEANGLGNHRLSGFLRAGILPILSLAIDPKNPNTLYPGLRFRDVWKSTEAGNNWTEINNGLYKDPQFGIDITTLAIKKIPKQTVDVLILDIYMAEMNGIEAIPIIKNVRLPLPIIAITGDTSLETEKKIQAQDIFYYFVKTIDQEEMKKAVESALSKKTLSEKPTLTTHQAET